MRKFTPLLLASLITTAPLAWATHDGTMSEHCDHRGSNYFSEADNNKDGVIDKSESQAMHEKHFNEMDANHDGKLSKDEIAACRRGGMRGTMHDKGTMGFNKADKDKGGTLDREEAKALPRVSQHFDEIDKDKDGTVDRDEVHNFMKTQPAK